MPGFRVRPILRQRRLPKEISRLIPKQGAIIMSTTTESVVTIIAVNTVAPEIENLH
jgi:hypothetical protein